MQPSSTRRIHSTLLILSAIAFGSLFAPRARAQTDKPFVVEYYYKTKWGHADEFIVLFKKNHYPVLKKKIELGRILQVRADQPPTIRRKTGVGTIESPSFSRTRSSPTTTSTRRRSSNSSIRTRRLTRTKSSAGLKSLTPTGISR
jgi:hypothetical protein